METRRDAKYGNPVATIAKMPVPEIMAVSIPEILACFREGEPEWSRHGNTIRGRGVEIGHQI
jgi:hypothetical protein